MFNSNGYSLADIAAAKGTKEDMEIVHRATVALGGLLSYSYLYSADGAESDLEVLAIIELKAH